MAERRMFAKSIIDSDAFLDMPLSAQALYFHLSMRADDEGFINNHRKIQRMIGASEDDFKILIAKNFVILFESGVIVIKHWKIHNYIRSDRLISTNYQEEKNLLEVKENGAYTITGKLAELEELSAKDKRKRAYQKSSLPYSFEYKIKRAFENKVCPVCKREMTSSNKSLMPTIQHNLPISKGGTHELENISVICESCNTSIQDNETGSLNNAEVVEMWDKIVAAERSKIDWFMNPKILENVDVSQMSVKCQSNVSIGKVRLGKDSIGKVNSEGEKRKRFIPPTLEEVKAYVKERNSSVDPKRFFEYYETGKWKDAKGQPVRNWKQKLITWEKKDKPNKFCDHPQSDTDLEDLEKRIFAN